MADITLKMATDVELLDEVYFRLTRDQAPSHAITGAAGSMLAPGNAMVGGGLGKADQEDTSDADDGNANAAEAEPDSRPDHDANHRVVRTKQSADRVYLIDAAKKTRQWMTNPAVVESYGFNMGDVEEIDDDELLQYQQGQAIFEPRT